jgi:hypothetical protein
MIDRVFSPSILSTNSFILAYFWQSWHTAEKMPGLEGVAASKAL